MLGVIIVTAVKLEILVTIARTELVVIDVRKKMSFENSRIIAAKKTDKVAASVHIPGARRRESKRRRPFAAWQAVIKCCNSGSEIKGKSNSNSHNNCKTINSE